jgi:hypothetical protein
MKRYLTLCSAIILLLLASAFGQIPDRLKSAYRLTYDPQEPGVEVVNNPKTPKNPSMRIVFKEDLTIGVEEGDDNYMFGHRVYFNADDEGNIYVTDWDRKRIQKYDPQGKYVRTLGRSGQGPGEFQNVWDPEFDADGHLYVLDVAAYRMSFFDKESGQFLKQIKIPSEFHPTLVNKRGYFVGDRAVVEDGPKGRKFTTTYGLFDDQAKILREFLTTVWEPKLGSGSGEAALVESLANTLSDAAFKPYPNYLIASNDDIWFGYPETYEVRIYGPDGTPKKVIRRDYDPRPVTAVDKRRFLEEQESETFRFLPPQAQAIKSKVIDAVRFPGNKPAYNSFILMENGWLAVVVESPQKNVVVLDIFDDKGQYIAQFMADIPSEELFFKNGKAYALETNEAGYKFIKRYSFEIK